MANQNYPTQTYEMTKELFQKLFPETKSSITDADMIKFEDNATVFKKNKDGNGNPIYSKIFDFSTRVINPNQITFPYLTTIEDSPYPNKYYWDGKSFQYNLIGTTPDGNSGGHDFLISCDFDIDPKCFFIWKDDPYNPGGMTTSSLKVTKVDILDVDSGIYKIHIATPENSSETLSLENFKNQVCIEKVRAPFKNTFVCSGLELDEEQFKILVDGKTFIKQTKISYIANPYNEMAFANRENINSIEIEYVEDGLGKDNLDIIKDGQKYYIPDKYRINKYLYFKPTSTSAGYLELR